MTDGILLFCQIIQFAYACSIATVELLLVVALTALAAVCTIKLWRQL